MMADKNPFKVGDRVRYKEDDGYTYRVLGIYSPTEVSLSLRGYKDTEQDYTTDINDIVKVK
jgi:small-conductance mechanosensitive channel